MNTAERLGTNICPFCSKPSVANVVCDSCVEEIETLYDIFRLNRDTFMRTQHGKRTAGCYMFNPLWQLCDPVIRREKNQELDEFARTWWRARGYEIETDSTYGSFKVKSRINSNGL